MTKEAIKKLIAQDHLAEAIEHLMTLVNAYLLKEKDADVLKIQHALIVNSGKHKEWEKDSRLGILERREEQTTIAQIRTSVLYAIEELPDQFWTTPDATKPPEQPIQPTEPKEKSTKQTANLDLVKNSSLLLNFYQTHGEHATTAQFFQLQNAIEKEFGFISDLDLDDLIAELAREERERVEQERSRIAIIEVEIPQSIQAFVAENKGEWARRQELSFLDELSRRFDGILAKSALKNTLDEAKEKFRNPLRDFVFIEGGSFLMGADDDKQDPDVKNSPLHPVRISSFYLSKYLVTLAQFERFIQSTGYQTDADRNEYSFVNIDSTWRSEIGVNWKCDVNGHFQTDKLHPVIHVSWNDAQAYCNWLAGEIQMQVRLPYEAEWEYACRAGTTSSFNTGVNLSTDEANYNGNYPNNSSPKGTYLERTSPVGAYAPNAWGLYDMHGNVWEWCEDWYSGVYYWECAKQGWVNDPKGPDTGHRRILRGGSWNEYACGSSIRDRSQPYFSCAYAGFRPAIPL